MPLTGRRLFNIKGTPVSRLTGGVEVVGGGGMERDIEWGESLKILGN